MKKGFFLLLVVALGLDSSAEPPPKIWLTDYNFHFWRDSKTNLLPYVVFRDLNSETVPHASVASQAMSCVEGYARRAMIPMKLVPEEAAYDFMTSLADICGGALSATGSIGLGTFRVVWRLNSRESAWPKGMILRSTKISGETTNYVALLELIDWSARQLELKTGILTNGDVVFATAGHWVDGFVPQYTIEIDDRGLK